MKIVILGGGIAGLCMGIYLHQNQIDFSINEKQTYPAVGGHAFLMHHDGFAVLQEITAHTDCVLPGRKIDTFICKDPQGIVVTEQSLDDWQCFKRTELLDGLMEMLPLANVHNGRIFSHFKYDGNKIIAAAFLNGELEYGDIFVGADGANSAVRREIFGEVKFKPGKVKELVGIVTHPGLAADLQGKFTKFQQNDKGLSFGVIPTSETELVWFMQYDPALGDVSEVARVRNSSTYPDALSTHCNTLLKDFPVEVQALLAVNDFTTTYVWNTQDFDLLPDFHYQNVVLIGDAAHVALPFTSSGTTNAVKDAKILLQCLQSYDRYQLAFREYYCIRAEHVEQHIRLGRVLRDAFLDPLAKLQVPLISRKG
ncbi:2-polyprenyl-6-methoxyphenol hydroxylase [Pedobacter westerhofensis]|uniref:2-polyprenyl-6-methoxyphenol hydroxylase n=1 Tax=Pedobacter westerhofensis TaxID=425512 RepID=A0A521C517_9SPHI|nr:FAD-dependent monooxygenase [Pedobacter westerhofensis]SMO54546.1 2-polyprenyl-6-methoxyphenol hydroxylase [Pedobacter westerhofensis]